MSLLTECELDCLSAEIESLLTETATILREEKSRDARGGTVNAWGIQATTSCNLTRRFGSPDQVIGGTVSNVEFWTITLPLDSDLLATDRIQVRDMVFEITGEVGLPTTAISRRVRLRRLPNVEPLS